jgi:maltose/moltooligosaccharide transporter
MAEMLGRYDEGKLVGKEKPNLSILQIINMSMGFLGIQMAFGLQNGNASRILANFGADVHELSWFWLVAPVTGLIVQPIIGHMGDNTWSPLGRRKPYFLIGAVLCAIGLVMLPNAASATQMMAANVLLLAVIFLAMMDASINVAMEPFRALVGDMLPKHQGTIGFSVQTILIGIGAVIGSELPNWLTRIGVSNEAPKGLWQIM